MIIKNFSSPAGELKQPYIFVRLFCFRLYCHNISTAKKDIQNAVNLCATGDNVWIKTGTYKPTGYPATYTALSHHHSILFFSIPLYILLFPFPFNQICPVQVLYSSIPSCPSPLALFLLLQPINSNLFFSF